jgi:6-phospho-3-hexuloisomerase
VTMSSTVNAFSAWLTARQELEETVAAVERESIDAFAARLQATAGRVFFSGQGRSGLLAHMAAMRFMHLGVRAHAVGEPTAPSIRGGDTLVMISGSGRTPTSVEQARIAAREGAAVLLVTQQENGPIQAIADETFVIAAGKTVQFGNTLFEHVALLMLDSVVLALMAELDEPAALMRHNHTNLQ